MQIFEFSISEIIKEINSSEIEQYYFRDDFPIKLSKKRILNKIRSEIYHKSNFILTMRYVTVIIALCICLPSSIIIASKVYELNTSSVITGENQSLIGTEVYDGNVIIYENGKYMDRNNNPIDISQYHIDNIYNNNRIVKRSNINGFTPSSIVETPLLKDNKSPEIILINGSLCILTQEDGNGWELSEGESIQYEFEKYESDVIDRQNLFIGIIKDGVMEQWETFDVLSGNYSYTADKNGIYYVYLLNGSSDYLSLKEGSLKLN